MRNKKVLILGGTGTLGSELVEQLLWLGVDSVRVYARSEEKMFWLKKQYPDDRMRFLIGDIRDKGRLNMACKDVDIVVNCAAMKHVQMCEDSPFECLQTNVVGVQNLLECAVGNNVEKVIQVSTDKSVHPSNFYGCSKLMAEHLVLNAENWQGNNRTEFTVVRSGNIKNSSGSVFEIWKKQYENKEPLTVTDPNAERYMASVDKIACAVIAAMTTDTEGLVVLNMPKYKVSDMLKEYGDYPIKIIGLQKGEKLVEELYCEGEKFTMIDI